MQANAVIPSQVTPHTSLKRKEERRSVSNRKSREIKREEELTLPRVKKARTGRLARVIWRFHVAEKRGCFSSNGYPWVMILLPLAVVGQA
jgi:hypothetical protein